MIYSKNSISRYSEETGFIKDNLEKVMRLLDVLDFIFTQSSFKDVLVLKGGTAINLVHTNLKRLSVDIDLDYHGFLDKERAFKDRETITKELDDYMIQQNYGISPKSRGSIALFSRMYRYFTASGNYDYIKVEINFMDRVSLYKTNLSLINIFDKTLTIRTPAIEELFGMKIAAAIDRSKPRDLYDSLFLKEKPEQFNEDMLRKAAVFYLSLDGIFELSDSSFNRIRTINQKDIKRELQPVLKKGEKFNLEEAETIVIEKLKTLLSLEENEWQYLNEFSKGNYNPHLLFDDSVAEIASKHPMAKWRVINIKK